MELIKRQLSKDRTKEIIKDYNKGMMIIDMVAKYRITSSRIYQILKKASIDKLDK